MLYLIKLSAIALLTATAFTAVSVYPISFTTIQGNTVAMQTYQGKKIAVIILPTTNTTANANFLKRVDSGAKCNDC